jgi:hypothetical protein
VGAALALVMLFIAALPSSTTEGFAWDVWLVGGSLFAALSVIAMLAGTEGTTRLEPLGAVAATIVSLLLVVWDTGSTETDPVTAADWLHAGASVTAYVALALAVTVLGIVRDSWRLTLVATVGLVVFTTVQSFAVFARVIEGAWLFMVLGGVFLATGYLFDRTRRQIAASLEEA